MKRKKYSMYSCIRHSKIGHGEARETRSYTIRASLKTRGLVKYDSTTLTTLHITNRVCNDYNRALYKICRVQWIHFSCVIIIIRCKTYKANLFYYLNIQRNSPIRCINKHVWERWLISYLNTNLRRAISDKVNILCLLSVTFTQTKMAHYQFPFSDIVIPK